MSLRRRNKAVLALGVVAAVLLLSVVLLEWNMLRGPVEKLVSAQTGRPFAINGNLDVDLSLTPRIRAERITLGNAAWGTTPQMAELEAVEFSVRLLDLLRGRVVLPDLSLTRPNVVLERHADGRRNWLFKEEELEEAGAAPTIGRLTIDQGTIVFRDAGTMTLVTAKVAATGQEPLPFVIKATGQYKEMRVDVQGRGGAILRLGDKTRPYPLDITAQIGKTRASARGTVTGLAPLNAVDMTLEAEGASFADIFPLVGIALPPSPPYHIRGRLLHAPNQWRVKDFVGRMGDSDLSGEVAIDTSGERLAMGAELESQVLDLDDLAGLVGATPSTKPGETASKEQERRAAAEAAKPTVLPDTPFKTERLRSMDAAARFHAQSIRREGLPLDDLQAHLTLRNGRLTLDPLNFGVADGNISSRLYLDAAGELPAVKGHLEVKRVRLKRLFPTIKIREETAGLIGGRGDFSGQGRSVADMLATLDGDIGFAMSGGQVSNLILEVLGIDAGEIIKFLLAGDKQVPLRCAVADFDVKDGQLRVETFVVDTMDTNIYGEGAVDFSKEGLDLTFRPQPKDMSILSGRAPLHVTGTFKEPKFRPDRSIMATRVGAGLLAAVVNPVLALVPFIETGPGENLNCAALIKAAKRQGIPPGASQPPQR